MIRLIIHLPARSFKKEAFLFPIFLGGGEEADVPILDMDYPLEPRHIRFTQDQGSLWCENLAHDPFATWNGAPFGKIEVFENHTLQIGNITIAVSVEGSLKQQEEPASTEKKLSDSSDPILFPDEELQALLAEAESFQEKSTQPLQHTTTTPLPNHEPKPTRSSSWKWLFLAMISSGFIALSFVMVIYLRLSDEEKMDEIRAARGMADLAMALLHAEFSSPLTDHHNGIDFEALQDHILAVVPSIYSPEVFVDNHGQYHAGTYSIRMYSNKTFDRFLLVGQPRPSLLNKLIPHSILTIDSETMEFHRLSNHRELNQLLAQSTLLDDAITEDIERLLDKGTWIRLSTLHLEKESHDFSPPSALAWLYPGAENRIYNAPRYYPFMSNLLKKMFANPSSFHEIRKRFPNGIIYFPDGKKEALAFQQTFSATDLFDFHIGYLDLNERGEITHSHLIKEYEPTEILTASTSWEKDGLAQEELLAKKTKEETLEKTFPIAVQQLLVERRRSLESAAEDLVDLIERERYMPSSTFEKTYEKLYGQFQEERLKENEKMVSSLFDLYAQYPSLPFSDFLDHIHAYGLEEFEEKK